VRKAKQPEYVASEEAGLKNQLLFVLLGWLVTRGLTLFAAFQTWHSVSGWLADVGWYNFWASNMINGQFPAHDPMWQYPPLAAVIFLIGYSLSHASVGFVSLALIADAGTMALLVVAQRRLGTTRTLGLWIWVAAPIMLGPIMLGRFDVFPTVAVIAALVFASSAESFGALVAIGALLKVWPVLALLATPRKDGMRSLIVFAGTFVAGSAIMVSWWPESFSFLSGQRARGLQIESVGALPYMWWNSMGHHVNVALQYGAVEVVAQGTRTVCLLVTVACLGLLGLLAILRLLGKLEQASPSHIAITAVLVSMCTSRVLSPQYSVWMIGLLALTVLDPPRNFKWVTILICLSAFAGNLLYPGYYIAFEVGDPLAVFIQTVRIVALIAATCLSFASLLEPNLKSSQTQRAKSSKAQRQDQVQKASR